jgi:hypothetical protein
MGGSNIAVQRVLLLLLPLQRVQLAAASLTGCAGAPTFVRAPCPITYTVRIPLQAVQQQACQCNITLFVMPC